MRDRELIRRNVSKLASKGKDQAFIDDYVRMEGYDPKDVFKDDAAQPTAPGKDPRIEREMGNDVGKMVGDGLRTAWEGSMPGQMLKTTEAMTGGASEDLLPLAGQIAVPAATAYATGGLSTPASIALSGVGAGYGEIGRQAIRKLRGKETSVEQYTKDVAGETLAGMTGEAAFRGVAKGAKLLAKTPPGQVTMGALSKVFTKMSSMTAKGQQAVYDVMNFMGDLHPGSVNYVMKRDPYAVFTAKNMAEGRLGNIAGGVVDRLEQTRVGANKAFNATMDNFYKNEYAAKYPFKKVTPQGIEKIKNEVRFYPGRVVSAGEQAMKSFGYTDRVGKLKPTVLGELGSKMEEGQRISDIIAKVKGFKFMRPEDALTMRQELDDIIYDGWKAPKTKEFIGQATSDGKAVLKSIRKELSDRLHTRIKGLKPMDEAYGNVMDTIRSAKPYFGDSIKAEQTLRKYNSLSRGESQFTQGDKEILKRVEGLIPHSQDVLDHLFAREFKPIISNFWRSRALASLAGGAVGAGAVTGHAAGAGMAAGAAMAATSPRLMKEGLKMGTKVAKGAKAVGKVASKAVGTSAKIAAKTLPVQGFREKKNEKEKSNV